MADQNKNSTETVQSLLRGMGSYLTTKTVVGEPIQVGDTTILPLCDVSFGVGAGAFNGEKKNNGASAMGGKINPTAMLVIQNGEAKIVSVNGQSSEDSLSRIINMVPGVVNKFFNKEEKEDTKEE